MLIKHLLLIPLFCLTISPVALCLSRNIPRPDALATFEQRVESNQAAPALTVNLEKGLLQFKTPLGSVLSGVRLRMHFTDDSSLSGEFELAGQEAGADSAGQYELQRYRLKPSGALSAALKDSVKAELEIRHYLRPEVIVAFLNYSGPALAARDGVQLLMSLDRFERGMALKRFKLYWTAPVFVSDHRFLSPANQLLLWRQLQANGYHLLVPLAGGGMIGEVGVSEINYRYEFRVSSSSYDPKFTPRRIPLFAYSNSLDPYRLPRDTYEAAFAASGQYGRLRWQKSYPEVFSRLGWCSWNAYGHEVTEEKILTSVRSLQEKQIPVGFVLVDDGWLTVKEDKLAGFGADPQKFPHNLAGLAQTLREQYHVPHIGVWHTFQGYWSGVDRGSEIGRTHQLFNGLDGKALPDPRGGGGESFYADWYRHLKEWGFDFVKVDGQGNNLKFTNGLMPLFDSGGGEHRNFQEAARKYFSDGAAGEAGRSPGLNVINCMEMSLENAFNWRVSNVARNSDDYQPELPQNPKDHVYQNAYNAYWTSNFAYPDWDMFQSHDAHAEYHAVARAISGGPIYITDQPGKERSEVLRPLTTSDGKLLMLDEPGQVTRDLLLTDVALEPVPLKVFGTVSRPGLTALVIAAFNVNKSAAHVSGQISAKDVLPAEGIGSPASVAVYQRSSGRARLLNARDTNVPFDLDSFGFDLFTLASAEHGIAVFGLLDKYLGPAAIVSQRMEARQAVIRLRESGDFGAWLERAPAGVELDGRALPPSAFSYRQGLLRVPQSSFGNGTGAHEVRILLAPRRK
jgi:raffinose synthase